MLLIHITIPCLRFHFHLKSYKKGWGVRTQEHNQTLTYHINKRSEFNIVANEIM